MTFTEINHPKAWEKLPQETAKAWLAFCIYRDLPAYGERTRSIREVQKEIGLKADGQLKIWSRKYSWVERALAYDQFKSSQTMTVREVAQQDFAKEVIIGTSMRISVIHRILDTNLGRIVKKQDDDPDYILDGSDLKQVTGVIKTLDDIQRRAAGLPTTYTGEKGKDVPEEEKLYIIGENAES